MTHQMIWDAIAKLAEKKRTQSIWFGPAKWSGCNDV